MFYACAPCREEFPLLQNLYDQLKPQGLKFVGINQGDPPDVIKSYLGDNNFTFDTVLNEPNENMVAAMGVKVFPSSYLIDRNGKVIVRFVGYDERKMKKALRSLGFKI